MAGEIVTPNSTVQRAAANFDAGAQHGAQPLSDVASARKATLQSGRPLSAQDSFVAPPPAAAPARQPQQPAAAGWLAKVARWLVHAADEAEDTILCWVMKQPRLVSWLYDRFGAGPRTLYRGVNAKELHYLANNGWRYDATAESNAVKFATPNREVAEAYASADGSTAVVAIDCNGIVEFYRLSSLWNRSA